MRKHLIISALLLTTAMALTACAPESTEPLNSPDTFTRPAVPQVSMEANPKTDNRIDAQQVSDIRKIATSVMSYGMMDHKGNDYFEGFADYAQQEKYTVVKGNHVTLSYAANGTDGRFLVRVWNPQSPTHKDQASSYAIDPYAGVGIAVEPYPTPEDLTETVDLTDVLTSQ